ncbi:hypothetical protein HDZ31DRAFT_34816 [Schizophyllum fasciatum]
MSTSTLAFSARALARRNTISHERSASENTPAMVLPEARDLHQRLLQDSLFSASYTRRLAECRWRDAASESGTQTGSDDGSEASRPRRPRRRRARTGDDSSSPRSNSSATTPTPIPTRTMPRHTWISLWFLLAAPIIAWDTTYLFFRPRSMLGGDLHWIWKPYEIYQEIDWIYGVRALEEGDGFPNAQAFLNILETLLSFVYLYLAHVAPSSRGSPSSSASPTRGSPAAPLIGFAAALTTLWKTVLYWAQEVFCSGRGCTVAHNNWLDLLVYWILCVDGFCLVWLVIPSIIVYVLGRDIARELHFAAGTPGRLTARDGAKKAE